MTEGAHPGSTDPVVVYDIMCEARNRLLGTYNALESDDEAVIAFSLSLRDRVDAVDIDDLEAQRELTKAFAAERNALELEQDTDRVRAVLDVARRRAAAASALANARLSGGAPSPAALAIFEAWVQGEISKEERSAAIAALPI